MENAPLVKTRKKRQLHHDRIVLDETSMDVLLKMQEQVHCSLSEVVKIDTRKLVNFLIQSRSQALSSSELKALKEKHFDQVKALEWALEQAREAKATNSNVTISEILKKLETPLVTEKNSRKTKMAESTKLEPAPLPTLEKKGHKESIEDSKKS